MAESDVCAAALGEALYGAGKVFRLFLHITVGTGISSCLVEGGRPFPDARGNALVFASSPLITRCNESGAVLRPILEEYGSGPALVERYDRVSTATAPSGKDVTARAAAGDRRAGEIVRSAGEALGVSVAWLINSLDPQAVVVGGGLGVSGGLCWESSVASCREHIWAEGTRDLPITEAAIGTDAGVIGAAAAWMRSRGQA